MEEENKEEIKNIEGAKNDEFAYLNRDFSSENFKIEIKNLPRFYGFSEFRKLLNEKLNLKCNKLKTPKTNCPFAFACFRNEEDRNNAIKVLEGYKWKGNILHTMKAKPAPDPLVRKRNSEDSTQSNKKSKMNHLSQEEKMKLSTIPLHDMAYEEQLNLKLDEMKKILRKLSNSLIHFNDNLKEWIMKKKLENDGFLCKFLGIRHAKEIDGYRNKCEYTVGINEETQLPTVGFRIGSYVNGITGVAPVQNLKHISQEHKKVVEVFQEFVRSSDLEVFCPEWQRGHFRQLTVRSATNQIMLIVGIHPQNLSLEEIQSFKDSLVEFFSKGNGKEINVTSLYYQPIVKKQSKGDYNPPEHLWGETHIYETLLNLKFKISPEAFFQINTKAAEILYESAIELAQPSENSSVLDVCCGTGTIGLCFSKHCKQVLGLEIIQQAILDAKENALINNIENTEFFAGKAEEILSSVCHRANSDDVIAIVDPPRAGLQQKAILHLRKMKKINKIIYISCNPTAAFKNFLDLGRPESKSLQGEQFMPTKAVAVDLFPYTKHCELVICFERLSAIRKNEPEENKVV